MRWNTVYLAGLGSYLPDETLTAAQAVAAGDYPAETAETSGYRAVRVAGPEETGPVMAAAAGRTAIERAGVDPATVGLSLHGSVGHQGQDIWTPAHFVAGGAGITPNAAVDVHQGSNSGLAAVELAAGWVQARGQAALVTVGDRFSLPYFDRWQADDQLVYGDGAAAAVLRADGGFAKLRSTASRCEPALEPLYRGQRGWTEAPFADRTPVDLGIRQREWLERHEGGYDDAIAMINKNFGETLQTALDDADVELGDADWFVHATMSRSIADWGFYGALGLSPAQTTYEWGLDLGHVGGADQLLGLDHLVASGRPRPGDIVVTASAGIGFMWTVAVLEILETPTW